MPKPWKHKYEQKPMTDEDKLFIEFNYKTLTDEQLADTLGHRVAVIVNYRRYNRLLRRYDISQHRGNGGNNIKMLEVEGLNEPTCLTLAELVKFHALLKHGATTWELCKHYNITESHCLECQVVAKMLNK
jgi:hypothetical protein